MENNGWIKEYNKKLDWEWFRTPNVAHFFDYCLLKMNKKDIEWRGITIKKGQFVTSREVASVETGLTIQQVRTCINKLKSTNEITIETTNKYSIITICNIDKYQNFCELCNQENNQDFNQQITNKQPTNNQQITTSKDNIDIIDIKNNKENKTLRVLKKKDELYFSDQETPSTSNLFEQDSTVRETNANVNVLKEKELNEKKKKLNCLPPATEVEVQQYCDEKGITNVDCIKFVAYYSSNGWRVGKNPMKNWHSAVSLWSRNNSEKNNNNTSNTTKKYPDYVYELPPAERKRRQLMGIS